MNFSDALNQLKDGKLIARNGWNGKGMWLIMIKGESYSEDIADVADEPYIAMFTAQKTLQRGWLASQADIFADDWKVVKLEI